MSLTFLPVPVASTPGGSLHVPSTLLGIISQALGKYYNFSPMRKACSIFSGAGKFSLAHEALKQTSVVYKRHLRAGTKNSE